MTTQYENINSEKRKLISTLIELNAFWSYNLSTINKDTVADSLLIELTLKYGDVEEIQKLFKIYPKVKIQTVWETILIPDERYYKLNFYLGLCFFHISDIKNYIKEKSRINSRYEKLRKFAENNRISIS